MAERVSEDGYLDQYIAVDEIASLFGESFVYEKGLSRAISPSVLRQLKRLTQETVVWEGYAKRWRTKDPGDPPGRRQY